MALSHEFTNLARKVFSRLLKRPGRMPIEYFRQFLPPAPVIIEAGSHNGIDTANLARTWPEGRVFGFEPLPTLRKQIEDQIRGLPNVCCLPYALGEREGEAEFYVSSGASDGSSSLLRPTGHLEEHPKVFFHESIKVTVVTLDQWVQTQAFSVVDFLWLDLQGGELAALRGASNLLPAVKVVFSEVCLKPLYAGAPLYPEFRAWMGNNGFKVDREEFFSSDAGNVVFIRDR
jgi:FkbM family methyltransferase